MSVNRKSRTTLIYTGKSWNPKFLTKREKKLLNEKVPKLTKDNLNKVRFELLLKKLQFLPSENEITELFEKFNQLEFIDKKNLRESVRSKKTKITYEELMDRINFRINRMYSKINSLSS